MKPEQNESIAADPHIGQVPFDAGAIQLESENARLQRLVAELLVRNQQLREELKSARRGEIRPPFGPLDSAPDPLTYQTDKLSTRVVTARLRP
jgi:hypothetical protein